MWGVANFGLGLGYGRLDCMETLPEKLYASAMQILTK